MWNQKEGKSTNNNLNATQAWSSRLPFKPRILQGPQELWQEDFSCHFDLHEIQTGARPMKQIILAWRPAQHLASFGEEVVREGRSENVNGGTMKCLDAPRRLIPLHYPSPRHSSLSYPQGPIPTTSPLSSTQLITQGKLGKDKQGVRERRWKDTEAKQH